MTSVADVRALPLTLALPILRGNADDAETSAIVPPIPAAELNERADLSEIVPGVFLGSWRAAADAPLLRACRITNVICMCAADTEFRWNGAHIKVHKWPPLSGERLCIAALDEPSYDLAAHFASTYAFISSAISRGDRVLVHCRAGASRSASVVIAYIMQAHNISLADAESLAVSRRPDVCANSGFGDLIGRFAVCIL